MNTNLTQHPCAGKCTEFKEEQCSTCLVSFEPKADFLPGDVVVFKNPKSTNALLTIECFQPSQYYWIEGGELVHQDDIRSATVAEIKAKRRLDPPVALFVSEAGGC